MDLYLIRHAEAAPLGEGITDDAERPLTDKGQAQAKSVAAGLQKRGVQLNAVITSPLLRARQTAEGLLKAWSAPAPALHVCDALAPSGKRGKVSKFVTDLKSDVIAVVGHAPDLDQLAGWLIGSKKAQIHLEKAGVACIVCEDDVGKGSGTLSWLVSPEWLGK